MKSQKLFDELSEKFNKWQKTLNDKIKDCEKLLREQKYRYDALAGFIGVATVEGRNAEEFKKERIDLKIKIEETEENLEALRKASGHRSFTGDLDMLWKTVLQEYCSLCKNYDSKEVERDKLKEVFDGIQRKLTLIESELMDLLYQTGTNKAVNQLKAIIMKFCKGNESLINIERELYCRLHGMKPNELPETWSLSIYKEPETAFSELLYDVFGKAVEGEVNGKPPKWN